MGGDGANGADGVTVPRCPECSHELNILRPDISFLNEGHAAATEAAVQTDLPQADLLVVLGASLACEPLRSLPNALHASVPQIVIGPCPPPALRDHAWDVELLGPCDTVVAYLARELGWDIRGLPDAVVGEPAHEPPNRFCFPAGVLHATNGNAVSGASDGLSQGELPPPQTPLAQFPVPLPAGGNKKRSAKSGTDGMHFSGATLSGSGIAARTTLRNMAPTVNAAKEDGGAEDQSAAATSSKSSGKRPMPPAVAEMDAKR